MRRYDKITPDGAKDKLFEQCEVRREVLSALSLLFEGRAYREVITPGFEFYDVFDSSSNNYFPQENMYKLTDLKGRMLVARPDSTVPIA
ncbi:MAG: ATP phosphoribosyltransferase regulatory subunit, partial [Oscillospiraceae bacterium]|nr:ATP phosphoribosyltransferase regulatory subunit [Oscillospiraceae bacterium]